MSASPPPGLARRRPDGAPVATVRRIRDDIDARVTDLLGTPLA
ncbi:hypothetical protein [Streptomyces sp. NPDC054842]